MRGGSGVAWWIQLFVNAVASHHEDAYRFVGESAMAALSVLAGKGDQYVITAVAAQLGDADRDVRGSAVPAFSELADGGNHYDRPLRYTRGHLVPALAATGMAAVHSSSSD